MTRVILFRRPVVSPETQVDAYEQELVAAGYTPTSVPLLYHELLLTEKDVMALIDSVDSSGLSLSRAESRKNSDFENFDSNSNIKDRGSDNHCENLDNTYEPFKSWILTSANAVDSLEAAVSKLFEFYKGSREEEYARFIESLTNFLQLQIFIVGPATNLKFTTKFGALYGRHGFELPKFSVEYADNASDLVKMILNYTSCSGVRSYLHLCSNISLKTIPNALASNKILLQSKIAYKTIKQDDQTLLSQLSDLIELRQEPGLYLVSNSNSKTNPGVNCSVCKPKVWACFFSPSGVDSIKSVTGSLLWWSEQTVGLVAIGQTTADHLRLYYSNNHMVVAKHPTPESLVKAIVEERKRL